MKTGEQWEKIKGTDGWWYIRAGNDLIYRCATEERVDLIVALPDMVEALRVMANWSCEGDEKPCECASCISKRAFRKAGL
jgi:hypothetical protein